MATYSISEVETLTGIQSHTLRVWERRYDLLKAHRTNTKIRYYDDSQLKLLLNVGVLMNHGIKISKLDRMSPIEISNRVLEIHDSEQFDHEDTIQILVATMLSFDDSMFVKTIKSHEKLYSLEQTVLMVIYPFLNRVGLLWASSRILPAQEHFASNLIREILFASIHHLPASKKNARKALLFLPDGDFHEVGLLLANYLLKQSGFHTIYLGQSVPMSDLQETIKLTTPEYALTIIVLWKEIYRPILKNIAKSTRLLLAGSIPDDLKSGSIEYLSSPQKIKEMVGTK